MTPEQTASQPWAVSLQTRAAVLAGVAMAHTPDLGEVERLVWKCLGETNARPLVRDAKDNEPIGVARWADAGAWQVSLAHHLVILGRDARSTADLVAAARLMLQPASQVDTVLRLMRGGTVFYGERIVRDRVEPHGPVLRVIADRIMVQVRAIDRRAKADIDPVKLRLPPFPT